MIALLHAPAPLRITTRLRLPFRLRAAWPAVAWACRWLGVGLTLGALTDAVVRLVA